MAEDLTKLTIPELHRRLAASDGTKENMLQIYRELSRRGIYLPNYLECYHGPRLVAEKMAALIPENRDNVRILDVGCGNGHLSEQLRTHGFKNIDGLDASEGMLMMAKEQNLYQNYICAYLTEKPLDIDEGTYDAITMSGGFAPGHMPCGALHEMIRLLKKGGYCCFTVREEFLTTVKDYEGLEPLLDKLEMDGKWERINRQRLAVYFQDKSGIVYTYRKL